VSETDTQRKIITALSQYERRLFRNNVGKAWQGKWKMLPDGRVVIEHPRMIDFGLATGSGDIIGVRSVEITPEMVGQRIGQLVSLEVKEATGSSEDQKNWHKMVQFMGGLSGVVRSVDEAATLLGARKK
jgi:hypothetical protein